ncbi:hypothetical protein HG530_006200 [Fusarium avenaceum]|nr:hypothetical protein HG530_006200 [Fusarium avenaceum]
MPSVTVSFVRLVASAEVTHVTGIERADLVIRNQLPPLRKIILDRAILQLRQANIATHVPSFNTLSQLGQARRARMMLIMCLDVVLVLDLYFNSQVKGIALLLEHALHNADFEPRTAHPSHVLCAKITLGDETQRLG